MLDIFKNLRKIWLEPKVFSVVFRSEMDKNDMVVWQVGAYSLEEALYKAKKDISQQLSAKELDEKNYKMIMYASDSPEKLMREFIEEKITGSQRGSKEKESFRERLENTLGLKRGVFSTKLGDPDEAVNPDGESANDILMKKIIAENNHDLLEKSKDLLTKNQVLYVRGKLKNKK